MFEIKIDGKSIPKNVESKPSSNRVKFSTNLNIQMLEQFRLLCEYKRIYLNVGLETLISYLEDETFLKKFLNDAKKNQKEYYNRRNIDLNEAFEKYKQDLANEKDYT